MGRRERREGGEGGKRGYRKRMRKGITCTITCSTDPPPPASRLACTGTTSPPGFQVRTNSTALITRDAITTTASLPRTDLIALSRGGHSHTMCTATHDSGQDEVKGSRCSFGSGRPVRGSRDNLDRGQRSRSHTICHVCASAYYPCGVG